MSQKDLLKEISNSTNFVELVSITPNAEEIIAFCARVSNPSNQLNVETAPKLLKYLINHKHFSPYEMVSFTVEISTSRAIAAQILRHRSFSFQEFSQRYAVASKNTYHRARRQDTKNRQNSVDDMPQPDIDWFIEAQNQVWDLAKEKYDEALVSGIAKEQARFLLPLSTETTVYMSGSIRSWIHYISLRTANGTQAEHKEIAIHCEKILKEQLPMIAKALEV